MSSPRRLATSSRAGGHPLGYLGKLLVVAQTGDSAAVARLMQEIEDLIALFGHPICTDECPQSGVKRTLTNRRR
jgi:hypothetical protein